jgi:small subunit ribosomal protein S2
VELEGEPKITGFKKLKSQDFMENVEYKDLLNAGVHFGHLKRKWNPKMAPYIFMERNGIHIIDLNKTLACLDQACKALRDTSRKGRKILFVATKKQAKEIVTNEAIRLKMPFVTERWLGGMLTNFATVRKSLKKLQSTEKMMKSDTYTFLAKRERLMVSRDRDKMQRVLGGIVELKKLPSALFVVDVKRENIAVREARRLNIPVFAIVDTNSDPTLVDYPIPANDDAFKSIQLIMSIVANAIEEGLMERKQDGDASRLSDEEGRKRGVVDNDSSDDEDEEDDEDADANSDEEDDN